MDKASLLLCQLYLFSFAVIGDFSQFCFVQFDCGAYLL